MAKRKSVSTRTRFEIFKRDGFRCAYCGCTPIDGVLHVDHIKPVADGGGHEDENLITACDKCNMGKSDVPLEDKRFKVGDPLRAAEHAKQLHSYLEAQKEVVAAKQQAERFLIDTWCSTLEVETYSKQLPSILANAVSEFGMESVCDFMSIVAAARSGWLWRKNAWEIDVKYFCGILRKRREKGWK